MAQNPKGTRYTRHSSASPPPAEDEGSTREGTGAGKQLEEMRALLQVTRCGVSVALPCLAWCRRVEHSRVCGCSVSCSRVSVSERRYRGEGVWSRVGLLVGGCVGQGSDGVDDAGGAKEAA